MRATVLAGFFMVILGPARVHAARARGVTVSGVVKAKGRRSHCTGFAKAYWSFDVGDLPRQPCKPRLSGYLITLNQWNAKRVSRSKAYHFKLQGVQFSPRLLVVPKDAQAYDVTIENQDRFKHQVFSPDAARLGKELIPPNATRTIRFDQLSPLEDGHVEAFRLRCSYFPHMSSAVVFVRSTAYAIVSSRGTFRIGHVSPGNHVLRVWHWGKKIHERQISVGKRGLSVTIDLAGKKPEPRKARPAAPRADGTTKPAQTRPATPAPRRKRRRRRR